MARLHVPLSTLRVATRSAPRMTRASMIRHIFAVKACALYCLPVSPAHSSSFAQCRYNCSRNPTPHTYMPAFPSLALTIELSIQTLFETYRRNPLRVMREIGIQTHLHSLLQSALKEDCAVQLLAGPRTIGTNDRLERVQMELRVQPSNGASAEKSDIVVLRSTTHQEPVSLTLAPNGHLDIISKIALADVDAIIEVKAACSADPQQRHLFRSDVEKLLVVARQTVGITNRPKPELHFVLVDKSLGVRAHMESRKSAKRDFHLETDLDNWTDAGRTRHWELSPKIHLSQQCPEAEPFVHVWFMEHGEGGSSTDQVALLYATSVKIIEIVRAPDGCTA